MLISDFFIILKDSVLPLFIVLGIAVAYEYKFRPDITDLNKISLQLLCPLLIFSGTIDTGYGFTDMAPMLLFMLLFTAIMAVIGSIVVKAKKMPPTTTIAFMSNASLMNFGNMGLTLVIFAFGKDVMVYAVVVWIVFNIPLSTYGVWLADDDRSMKRLMLNFVKVPIFPSFVLAITLNQFGVTVPDVILKPVSFIGAATVPVMTLIFGFKLVDVRYKPGMLGLMSIAIVVRLIVSPVVAYGLLQLFTLPSLTAKAAFVMVSTPMASSPIMYAIAFKRDHELTTALVLVTTAVSVITLPLVIMFANTYL